MEKKIYLEQLFDKIRGIAEEYETDEIDTEALLLKEKETTSFAEELLRVVNEYIKSDITSDEEIDEDAIEEEELYISDWFDDDLD